MKPKCYADKSPWLSSTAREQVTGDKLQLEEQVTGDKLQLEEQVTGDKLQLEEQVTGDKLQLEEPALAPYSWSPPQSKSALDKSFTFLFARNTCMQLNAES